MDNQRQNIRAEPTLKQDTLLQQGGDTSEQEKTVFEPISFQKESISSWGRIGF